jgi:hypothetical protein
MLDKNVIGSTIHVNFKTDKEEVYYVIKATGQENKVNAINKQIRLIKGRVYYIPSDNIEINSDDFNILKVFSNIADKISIAFVKEGYCCIIPIVNNILIKDGQQLCSIHN